METYSIGVRITEPELIQSLVNLKEGVDRTQERKDYPFITLLDLRMYRTQVSLAVSIFERAIDPYSNYFMTYKTRFCLQNGTIYEREGGGIDFIIHCHMNSCRMVGKLRTDLKYEYLYEGFNVGRLKWYTAPASVKLISNACKLDTEQMDRWREEITKLIGFQPINNILLFGPKGEVLAGWDNSSYLYSYLSASLQN